MPSEKEDPSSTNRWYGTVEKSHSSLENKDINEHHDQPSQRSIMGILLIMLGSFSFSCMFLFVKLMQGTANSFTLVFYRSLVQIVLSLTPLLLNGENPMGDPSVRKWLWVRGGFGSGAVIAFFYAIQNLTLPDAVTLQFTTPIFAAAFAVCLAGEKWMRLDMVGAVVCISGVALIAHPSWLFGDDLDNDEVPMNPLAIVVALAGAAMAGLAYMSVRRMPLVPANVMVLYYAVISIPIVVVGSYFLLDDWKVWGSGMFSGWDYFMFLLTGLGGFGGQYYTNLGLQRETAATGTLVTCTQIVWTYIFELAFLHESINGWSVLGTGLILGFMLVVGYIKMSQAPDADDPANEPVTDQTALLCSSVREEGPAFALPVEEP